jgi:hypothetical protein
MHILKKIQQKQVNNKLFALLLILSVGAVAVFWWFSNRQHPLAQAEKMPLCKVMPPLKDAAGCEDTELVQSVAAHSIWSGKNGIPMLTVDLISNRNLSEPQTMSTKTWLDSAKPEIKASGRQDIAEPIGPWASALITRSNKQQELLFEDNGVVVILQSEVMDRNALLAYATLAAKALRKASVPAATSSPAAAKPK